MPANELVLRGPLLPAVVRLAAPVIAGEALHVAFHLVDLAIVSLLGAWATAAIAACTFALWTAFAVGHLVTTGIAAHVSQAIGAGDRARAADVAGHAAWLCVLLGVPVAIAGYFGARPLFELVVDDPQVQRAATGYLQVIALGMPIAFLINGAAAVLRACGNTRLPLLVTGSAVLANCVLAPALVFGWGPLPRLGVPGSAIATVTAMAGALVAYALIAIRGHADLPFAPRPWRRVRAATLASLARVGVPYCAIGVLYSAAYTWYAHVAAAFGAAGIAVVGIANRLESVTYLSADGFAIAASTFVGQNLGARNARRAERGAWTAAGIMSAVGFVFGVAMMLAPEVLLAAFTRDADVMALGVPYVCVLGACQAFTGLEGVLGGAFAGAGDTVPPLLVHVVVSVARVPLAWYAAVPLGLGVMGIAWTMTITCVLRALVMAWWFRRGAWKRKTLERLREEPAYDSGRG